MAHMVMEARDPFAAFKVENQVSWLCASERTEGRRMSSPKVQKPENQEVLCLRAREDGQLLKRRERKFSLPPPFYSIEALI